MSEADQHRAFIRAYTALTAPSACPEFKLHLATAITPLWQASETFLHAYNVPPPYWAFAWAGGQALARHVLDNPELVRGRSVLDFASGCGVAAIAAALAGAARVVASDLDPVAAIAAAMNAEANGVVIESLAGDTTTISDRAWEIVLAGDICYEKPMTDRCMPWLRELAARGALVLLADPGRAYLPDAGLELVARYLIPTSREIEDRDSRDTAVYRLTSPA